MSPLIAGSFELQGSGRQGSKGLCDNVPPPLTEQASGSGSEQRAGFLSCSLLCCVHCLLIFLKDAYSSSWHCILPCQYPGEDYRRIFLELSLRILATLGRAHHTPFMSLEPKLGHMPIPGLVENKGINQSHPAGGVHIPGGV